MFADSQSLVVVLLLQVSGVHGHIFLHTEEEEQPDLIPACVPPCHHVSHLVGWGEVGAWRTSFFWCNDERIHPCDHVHVLWPGSTGTSVPEVPVVEEIPDPYTAGRLAGSYAGCRQSLQHCHSLSCVVGAVCARHGACCPVTTGWLSLSTVDAVGTHLLRSNYPLSLPQLLFPCLHQACQIQKGKPNYLQLKTFIC